MTMPDDAVTARRLALLQQAPLFKDVGINSLQAMLPDLHLREYGKGELVIRQGDDSADVFIIIKGRLRIYRTSPGGEETSIDIFGPY